MPQAQWTYRCLVNVPDPTNPKALIPCGVQPPASFSEAQPPALGAGGESVWQPPKVSGMDPYDWMLNHMLSAHGFHPTNLHFKDIRRRQGGTAERPVITFSSGGGVDFMEQTPQPSLPGATPGFLKQYGGGGQGG